MKTCGDFGGEKLDGSPCKIRVKDGLCGLHRDEFDRRDVLLTPEQIAEVGRLAEIDCTIEEIAHVIGIPQRTLQRRMEDQDEVVASYQRGKAKAHAWVKGQLRKQMQAGNVTAMIFYLKTQCGWSEKQRLEHSGEGGGPIALSWTEAVKAADEAA